MLRVAVAVVLTERSGRNARDIGWRTAPYKCHENKIGRIAPAYRPEMKQALARPRPHPAWRARR